MKQVYVIDFGGRVKVGITDDVKRRIYQIQCSVGAKAIRFAAIPGDYSLERKVQRGLSEYHIVGEFFSCSFDFACSILGNCCGEMISSEHIFFPGIKMPSRTGRPPKGKESRTQKITIRISQEEAEKIQECAERLEATRTDAIMEAIDRLKADLDKK